MTLLVLIAYSNKVKAHIAAIAALVVANLVAIYIFTMPGGMAFRATVLGAVTGFFPIGWIVLNVIFLYRLTVEKGAFETLQTTIGGVTRDRRLQLLLIAFSFGAFFEGASGFGTPVAVTAAILIWTWLFASCCFRPLTDREYGSSSLRRARHADRRPCECYWVRPLRPRSNGRATIAVLLATRTVLADLGLRGLARNASGMARNPGVRRVVRYPTIPDLELHQSLDR